MGEFDNDARFVCDRLKQVADDFTALGRWGWGATITFATAVLLASGKEKGELFAAYSCESSISYSGRDLGIAATGTVVTTAVNADANEVARGFLYVVGIAAVAYGYFVLLAWRKVLTARRAVRDLRTSRYSPALAFAKKSAPTNWELACAAFIRLAMFGVLFLIWWMLFDMTRELLQCLGSDLLGHARAWLGRLS